MLNIIWDGVPLTVWGEQLRVGERMLNFSAVSKSFVDWSLSDVRGIKIISVIPSLDTPVCQLQTRRFNRDAVEFNNVSVITISLDLPFAQKRWCGAEGIDKVIVISDYKNREFAKQTCLLIHETKLLTRAVFVLDTCNNIKHLEYLKDISKEPDYDKIREAIKLLS